MIYACIDGCPIRAEGFASAPDACPLCGGAMEGIPDAKCRRTLGVMVRFTAAEHADLVRQADGKPLARFLREGRVER